MVYQGIRNTTVVTAKALTPLLKLINFLLLKNEKSQNQQKLLSVLNGVIGNHLVQSNNSLAITMQFRVNGKPLSSKDLTELIEKSHGKILILVHGSCMNDLLWKHQGHEHGEALALETGLTPLYLNYNSGLHISENGKQFSALLESLNQSATKPLDLFILAHSMGGLVSRSACYYAEQENNTWLKQLKKMIFLGTPHHGAPLEKLGNWLEQLLSFNRYTKPFIKLTQLRSNGITDLRYGYIIEDDWLQSQTKSGDQRQATELPLSVECFCVAATTGNKANRIVGDGLVTVASALGQHNNPAFQLSFPEENQMIARNVNHMELLSNSDVYLRIKDWLSN